MMCLPVPPPRTGKGVRIRLGLDQNGLQVWGADAQIEHNLIMQSSHLGFKVPIFCPRWASLNP